MTYRYHVFVSYRREDRWTSWTRDYFRRELAAYMQQELAGKPDIFVDDRIHIGADYVATLADSLAYSRAMVAIFSADYFTSPWCLHELDLMLDRGVPGLIVPVVVHDCEDLPLPVSRIQCADLKRFRITKMNMEGQTYEEFSSAIGKIAPDLCRAIRSAPAFDIAWPRTCVTRLMQVHDAAQQGGLVAPTWFTPPAPPALLKPPRLGL